MWTCLLEPSERVALHVGVESFHSLLLPSQNERTNGLSPNERVTPLRTVSIERWICTRHLLGQDIDEANWTRKSSRNGG